MERDCLIGLNEKTIRKAAVLVRSLDADAAAALLSQLSMTEARAVRMAVRELGPIADEERLIIADELRNSRRTPPPNSHSNSNDHLGGVELALGGALESEGRGEIAFESGGQSEDLSDLQAILTGRPTSVHAPARPSVAEGNPDRPFSGVVSSDSPTVAAFLSREQPQTIAVVLSYLAPALAAEVVAQMTPSLQSAAIERLAELGDTDPESLKMIADGLDKWILQRRAELQLKDTRFATLKAIVDASPNGQRSSLLQNLGVRAPELARQLASISPSATRTEAPVPQRRTTPRDRMAEFRPAPRPQPEAKELPEIATPGLTIERPEFTETQDAERPIARRPTVRCRFEDVERMEPRRLAMLLRRIDPEVFALALAGASESMLERIASLLSWRQARALRRSLSTLGPTRLRDVDLAQQRVAEAAADLVATPHTMTA